MKHISPLLGEAEVHLSPKELRELHDAYELAQGIYGLRQCETKETYLEQVEKVALLLLHLHPDVQTLIATLLQYARTKENLEKIKQRFGRGVIDIIASLSILEGAGTLSVRTPSQLRRIALVLSKDIRVLLIFLHNRWHILDHANALPDEERKSIARDTLTVLAPICARLGIYSLKYALETLAFTTLFPNEAGETWQSLSTVRREHGSFLTEGQRKLERLFRKEGIRAHITTREKHPYSVFRKMRHKGLGSATDLYDLYGMRILVECVEDCYRALGVIHRTYRPIAHRIKDYIATPKPNGYRSLHTTVRGLSVHDSKFPVEIQIRTFTMDEEAEYGVAAHWDYKERITEEPTVRRAWQERMMALKHLSEIPEGTGEHSEEYGEEFLDRIYVLTPRGDPIELPKGATPLDFAFRIHTEIGLCFRSAKVNGAIATIDHNLENGDSVEIQTWSEPKPSPEWVKIVHTKEARSKIRGYFHQKEEVAKPAVEKTDQHFQRQLSKMEKGIQVPSCDVQLASGAKLPYRFASCCSPQKHRHQRPPIIGCVTRAGMVNVHWSGCRMLKDANQERFVRAEWMEQAMEQPKKKTLIGGLRRGLFTRSK
jgi:GTP diphosphokinase / guanosine-3',5'-bis(diphosphate) 3'-diphosphatase